MRFVTLAVLICLFMCGCEQSLPLTQYEFSGTTMGTTFNVKVVGADEYTPADELPQRLQQRLHDIEQQTSTYMPESDLSLFNSNTSTSWVEVPFALCVMVEEAQQLSRETRGTFDITVGPLVNLWGFGPAGRRDTPPTDAEVEALLPRIGFKKLHTDCAIPALRKLHAELYVDLSGWAKGYATDELAAVLTADGAKNFLVEVGGEIRVQGLNSKSQEWVVAVEKPTSASREIQSTLHLSNTGLATSGDYRNYFEHAGSRYSHTIDPRNGRPVTHQLASVTVTHASAAKADGLATALLVLGPEEGPALAAELGVDAVFLVRTEQGFETIASQSIN